jgi:hypothetical protein
MARYAYGYVDSKRATTKLNKAYEKLVRQSWVSTKDLVTFGANFAKQIVPYDTGQTWKAIKTRTTPKREGGTGEIYINNIQREDGSRESLGLTTLQLVGIMHRWSGSERHFKTGDPQFMYTAREVMKTIGNTKIRKDFKSIKFKN